MFEKIEVLIIAFILLLVFYIVISLGAGKRKKSLQNPAIKNYLFSVRILIGFIAIVVLILWFFL